VSLSKATFVKFRAQSCDFLEVSNPRALLEVSLRKFTCLTVGDTICIPHSNTKFYLDVREVQPNGAASIIETDCNVDFEEPLGYQDSKYGKMEREHKEKEARKAAGGDSGAAAGSSYGGEVKPRVLQKARVEPTEAEVERANAFKAFSGVAKRIDGKLTASAQEAKLAGGGDKDGGSNTGSGTGSAAEAKSGDSPAPAAAAPPVYQSRIGDKYSTKKTAVSAFTGKAYKLN
jgi:ubiquitin fusion degradation protein 1